MRLIDRLVSHLAMPLRIKKPHGEYTHLGHISEATGGGSKQGPRNNFLGYLWKSLKT